MGRARCREVAAGNPTGRRTWFANFSFDGDVEVEAVLVDRGYAKVRWDAEMLRPDLENLPTFPVPEGYVIRVPTEAELPAVFEMSVLAFAEHWGQNEADEQRFEDWADDPRFRRELQVVAWKGDAPAALVSNVVETRDDGSVLGLLNGVCTHPGPSAPGARPGLHRREPPAAPRRGGDRRLPRRGHGQPQPGHRAVPVVRVRGREQQHAVPQALRGRGGQPMTTSTQPATADVAVVDAPAIAGLTFRRGRDGDWVIVADLVNRVRMADGVEELLTAGAWPRNTGHSRASGSIATCWSRSSRARRSASPSGCATSAAARSCWTCGGP